MKLKTFSVTNFRSITKAHEIELKDVTVLLGKNNEGKSNLLKALTYAMNAIADRSRTTRNVQSRPSSSRLAPWDKRNVDRYSWARDFPIELRGPNKKRITTFKLVFELTSDEQLEFRKETRSKTNGLITLLVDITSDDNPQVLVVAKGRGSKVMNSKAEKIASFVASRLFFNYIPAVRTYREMTSALEQIVSRELQQLEEEEDYKSALSALRALRAPKLKKISDEIKRPLSEFLPNIKDVEVRIDDDLIRTRLRSDFDVIINDGVPTSIELKGDGVKSLAALGLLKNLSLPGVTSIIAVEEPESHLHSGAIHQLKEILYSMKGDHQIVLTSHNPLFADVLDLNANVIVDSGKAKKANSIMEIRDILGVRVSDNLTSARIALVVEGKEDKDSLQALLSAMSERLSKALRDGILIIEALHGSAKLSYQLTLLESQMCVWHVLMDDDGAGRHSSNEALNSGLLKPRDLTLTICTGQNEAEFEDMLEPLIYTAAIESELGILLDSKPFTSNKKWSDRVADVCAKSGKPWNGAIKATAKKIVNECVMKDAKSALSATRGGPIANLIRQLEDMVSSTTTKAY